MSPKSKIIWNYDHPNVQIQINLQIIYVKTCNLYIWDWNYGSQNVQINLGFSNFNLGSIYSLGAIFKKIVANKYQISKKKVKILKCDDLFIHSNKTEQKLV